MKDVDDNYVEQRDHRDTTSLVRASQFGGFWADYTNTLTIQNTSTDTFTT